MSLYFDCAINSRGGAGNIHLRQAGQNYFIIRVPINMFSNVVFVSSCTWHSSLPLLAVGSYSEEKGGYVSVYTGEDKQDTIGPLSAK
jgi:hypothetical protein